MTAVLAYVDGPELLPCPFCGSPDIRSGDYTISCGNCDACIQKGVGEEDWAIEAWNTRPEPSEVVAQAQAEAAEAAVSANLLRSLLLDLLPFLDASVPTALAIEAQAAAREVAS